MQKMLKNTSSSTLFLWVMLFFVLFAPDAARADIMDCIKGNAADTTGLSILSKLACKAVTTLSDLRKIVYVLSGFGLIAFSFAAIFNKISFRHLANIGLSLFILSMLTPFIEYFTHKPGVDLKYGKYLNPNYSAFDYSIIDTKGLEFTIDAKDMQKDIKASKDMQKEIEGKENLFEGHEGYNPKPMKGDIGSGPALRDYENNKDNIFDAIDNDGESLFVEYDPEAIDPKGGKDLREYADVTSDPLFNPGLFDGYKPDGKNLVGTDLSTLGDPEDTRTGWQKLKDTVKDITSEGVKAYNTGTTLVNNAKDIKNIAELNWSSITNANGISEITTAIVNGANGLGTITNKLGASGSAIGGNYTDKEGKPGLGQEINNLFGGLNDTMGEVKDMTGEVQTINGIKNGVGFWFK